MYLPVRQYEYTVPDCKDKYEKKEADLQASFFDGKEEESMKEQSLKEKLHLAKLGIMASIPEAILFCNSVIVCAEGEAEKTTGNAVEQKIGTTSTSIWGTMKVISMSLLVVVLGVCGLILMVGTQKMKETVKEHFYSIVIGCLILFLAQDIADYMEKTFG